jgi:hypothetical protein
MKAAWQLSLTTFPKPLQSATVSSMGKTRRVLVCGSSVALAGIETSLSLDPDCQVLSHALPIDREELRKLDPHVILFDLDAVSADFVYIISRELPGLLFIGIDLETNRAVLWSERQAVGMSSQDLADMIRHSGTPLADTDAEHRAAQRSE